MKPAFKEVSAVLFCNTLTLGKVSSLHKSEKLSFDTVLNIRYLQDEPHFRVHEVTPENPEQLLDGLYIFHNPFAKNKIDFDIFNKLAQFSMDEYGPHQIGNYPLIVSRFHTNMLPSSIIPSIKTDAFSSYNPEYCMRELKKESCLLKPAKSERIRQKEKRKKGKKEKRKKGKIKSRRLPAETIDEKIQFYQLFISAKSSFTVDLISTNPVCCVPEAEIVGLYIVHATSTCVTS